MGIVNLLPLARSDLLGIAEYVCDASDSLAVGEQLIDRICERCELQSTRPLVGELRPDLGPDVRQCFVGVYIVFYLPIEDGIEVLRVLHGNRDIPKVWRGGDTD